MSVPPLAFEGVPCGVYVRGLGVVDILHTGYFEYRLEPVLYGRECFQAVSYHLVADAGRLRRDGCGHRVVDVVPAAQREFAKEYLRLPVFIPYDNLPVSDERSLLHFLLLRERQHLGLQDYVLEVTDGDSVVRVEDEAVVGTQVPHEAELGLDIVLHLVAVTVEVVGRDVGDYRYVRAEVIAVVQLETADFEYIVVVLAGRDLICVALAYVPSETYVEPGFLQQVINERGRGGLSVRAGHADLPGAVVARRKLYLRDYMDSGPDDAAYDFRTAGDAGTLYDLVGIEYPVHAVPALLEGYLPLAQGLGIFVLERPAV